jgi:NAD(P)-dependent dehydrogenase (short-subunit alcohol dehydrogenase family)
MRRRTVAEAKRTFGRLDVLVNNADVYQFAPAIRDYRSF